MYLHQPFPSWRYHRSGKKQLVHNENQHDELQASDPDNWAETPAAFVEDVAPEGEDESGAGEEAETDDAPAEPASEPEAAPAAAAAKLKAKAARKR